MEKILITKTSGEREPFSDAKLRRSLQRVHASPALIDEIIAHVESELTDGMKTSDVYRKAFSLLRKNNRSVAARYSLKNALMELGPTGRPFERFVGELMKSEGFDVEMARVVPGVCVKHEVDVVGTKGDRHVMVECKFHNQPGLRSDVKISLYVQARFEDVERKWQKQPQHGEKFHEVWLVTNTKFTSDACDYAACVRMCAIGWNYPLNDGLEARIDRAGLHPITCLTSLSGSQKRRLIERDIILCKELLKDTGALQSIGVPKSKVSVVTDEINNLCHLL